MTGAVRQALAEALAEPEATRAGTAERLLALAAESRGIPDPVLRDEEIYDEHGLPR